VAGPSLQATFEVHPWVAAALKMVPGADPLDAIAHPTLRALVVAIVSYKTDVVAAASTQWYESALTAFLRVIDTIRGTLDPSKWTPDSKAKLIGEPILVMGARLRLEGTTAEPKDLIGEVPTLSDDPALPTIPVRVGDVTRPDDGVLGCFEIGASPDASVFVPVSVEAATKTIVNQLSEITTNSWRPAVHPFIAQNRDTTFELTVGEQLDLVILADPRGGLYATSGVLPRKKISMPEEFLRAALSNLEPTFSIGPILATGKDDFVRALIPPPRLNGMDAEFLYRRKSEGGSPDSFPSTPLVPVPPTAELPVGRATLAEGWVRMFEKKK
jgi:hypothetical protein